MDKKTKINKGGKGERYVVSFMPRAVDHVPLLI